MFTSKTTVRVVRTVRTARTTPSRSQARQVRLASTTAEKSGGLSPGLIGGITGGTLVFGVGYAYYHFSGARSIVSSANSTKAQFSKLTSDLQSAAPSSNEAISQLRSTAERYAVFVPGGKAYLDTVFKDLETVQAKHSKEVDKITSKAYADLKDVSKAGLGLEAATKGWEILEKTLSQLGELAKDSAGDILDNHPQFQEKFGENIEALKTMAANSGEEGKAALEETYSQLSDAVRGGPSWQTGDKITKIIREKTEKLQKLGDEAWKKGMETARPYLDRNSQVKELIEKNEESLKTGDFGKLFEMVKGAVEDGNTDKLKEYVKEVGEKGKKSQLGQSISQYTDMIPGSGEIFQKLEKLQSVAKEHGEDAEKILKDSYEEIRKVLEKRTADVEKLVEKAANDAKK